MYVITGFFLKNSLNSLKKKRLQTNQKSEKKLFIYLRRILRILCDS